MTAGASTEASKPLRYLASVTSPTRRSNRMVCVIKRWLVPESFQRFYSDRAFKSLINSDLTFAVLAFARQKSADFLGLIRAICRLFNKVAGTRDLAFRGHSLTGLWHTECGLMDTANDLRND